jgi:predicted aldo/keto reductase-like oxidoreductase
MMLAYHHGAGPNQMDIISRANAEGIGIIAMKTLKGARHRGLADFRPEADTYAQAAFKWVLSNEAVSCLVISFFDNQHPDEYLFASGKTLDASDMAVLEKYDRLIAGTHCFQHCGDCLSACTSALPINDILRHRMYFEDYGDEKQAMQLYAKLEKTAAACIDCAAPCLGSCPEGIQIQERMIGAHERLRWA